MAQQAELRTVRGLDLQRYAGRWYEIACLPSRFQPSGGVNTRATYTPQPDGTMRVLNETWTRGGASRAAIEGKAWLVDSASDEAKLVVQFRVPPFLPLFPVNGDYWVMDLDADGYSWALVGQPSRKYLWVRATAEAGMQQLLLHLAATDGAFRPPLAELGGDLLSRTPQLDEATIGRLLSVAEEQGYDISKVKRTEHVAGVGGDADESAGKSPTDRGGWWLGSMLGLK
eukprot:SM000001S04667  [mRNA]  locus=s1:1607224:1607936:+ [translate_table: standard]